ncbi:MAG: hypothetical protein JWO36_5994 [Myxococcales bacterium]|nr:hypothetical protein [Myxococcales bacterium]
MRSIAALCLLAACGVDQPTPELSATASDLSAAVKQQRYTLIRDSAAEMGMHNAALLAGIATSETGLAHCQSEATYACPGPASSSCNGGPVIAGSADGPCSLQQGGLGMFQFDAGTYAQTVAAYGPDILTVSGNTAQAVWFVNDKVILDINGVKDWLAANDWLDGIVMQAGTPRLERWATLMACRYNGCCATSTLCTTRANGYRDNALASFTDMGAAFWKTSDRCASIPADGVIDERSACYVAGGDPRYWRQETVGYAGTSEWTGTTSNAAAANFGEWIIKPGAPGSYHLEVNLSGAVGTSKKASYEIAHAGMVDHVVIDQTSSTDFVALGDFDFAGTGDEHVFLGDNTGEPGTSNTKVAFDAIRVTSLDGGGGSGSGDPGGAGTGGCASSRDSGGALALLLALPMFRRRGRRQPKT